MGRKMNEFVSSLTVPSPPSHVEKPGSSIIQFYTLIIQLHKLGKELENKHERNSSQKS